MAPAVNLRFALSLLLKYRRQLRRRNYSFNEDNDTFIILLLQKNKTKKIEALLSLILALYHSRRGPVHRSVRRKIRNVGWWDRVWDTYDNARFKETFRVSRGTFIYILNEIRPSLERETLTEKPITPECRLAVCLYRLSRGDYMYTFSLYEHFNLNFIGCQGSNKRIL
jgi:hypothetical protein